MNTIEQLPHEQFVKLFLAEQYRYFEEQEFQIFETTKQNDFFKRFYFIEKEKYKYVENEVFCKQYYITAYILNRKEDKNFYSIISYSSHLNAHPVRDNFISDFYNNHPECRDEIIKLIPEYKSKSFFTFENDSFMDKCQAFINNVTHNKEEIIDLLHKFPKEALDYTKKDLEDIENYFIRKNFTKEEFSTFLYDFLYDRKVEATWREYDVRDYLMQYFNQNEQQLTPYFDLFPVLKAEFIEPEVNIFLNEYKFTDILHLSVNEMRKSFLIEKWTQLNYQEALFSFCSSIKKYYQLECCFTEKKEYAHSPNENFFIIEFLHNNEKLKKEDIKILIVDYFKMLRCTPEYVKSPDAGESWLLHNTLENNTEQKNIKHNKKKI